MFDLSLSLLSRLATKPLTTRETEAMKQAAKAKRQNSRFRTAPDGRLLIDVDDEEGDATQRRKMDADDDDNDDDDINREDIKDLMETLSLSQRAKNKRKRQFDNDEENDDDDDEKQSRSVHSKYRGNVQRIHIDSALSVLRCSFSRWWWYSSKS